MCSISRRRTPVKCMLLANLLCPLGPNAGLSSTFLQLLNLQVTTKSNKGSLLLTGSAPSRDTRCFSIWKIQTVHQSNCKWKLLLSGPAHSMEDTLGFSIQKSHQSTHRLLWLLLFQEEEVDVLLLPPELGVVPSKT